MTTPAEREFAVFRRGELREDILRFFRNGLRNLNDPSTNAAFTEDTIRRVTTAGSRFYVEADAIDLVTQGIQKRDEFLAQQMRIDRAGTAFLQNFHAPQWGEVYLPATGGSGNVTALGTPGTTWVGSTTVPSPFATFGTDEAGKRYQVLVSGTADSLGVATLLLLAIDGGDETNIEVGSIIRWSNPPPGAQLTATVVGADFTGGGEAETDADFASRLAARVRHKPGAGNDAQIRAIARASSNACEDAFVYPCAMNAGTVLVAITQKRGSTVGPNARVAGAGLLTTVTAALVPPGSPFLPAQAFVAVVPDVPEPADAVVQLALRKGSAAGWTDLQPFPPVDGTDAVAVTLVTNQTDFRITTSGAGQLPNGVAGPLSGVSLMIWDVPTSRFISLAVSLVTDLGAGVYRVQLLSAPSSHTIALGDWISPGMSLRTVVAQATEAYFDSLGPGEVIDLATSVLAVRAFRRPVPSEEYPARAGQSLISFITEALVTAASDATLASITVSTPTLPGDPIDGPSRVTLGKFAVYDLT